MKSLFRSKLWLLALLLLGIAYMSFPRTHFASRGMQISAAASFFSPQGGDSAEPVALVFRSAALASTPEIEIESSELSEHSASGREESAVEKDYRRALDVFTFEQEGATETVVQTLKAVASDHRRLAAFFLHELQATAQTDGKRRDRLVWVANAMQLPEMAAFWEDLLLRKTPRYAREDLLRNPKRATEESRAVDIEQLQAIRNLGLIGEKQAAARSILQSVVLSPNASVHRALHREQALLALRQAAPLEAKKIFSQLSNKDEEYLRLKKAVER